MSNDAESSQKRRSVRWSLESAPGQGLGTSPGAGEQTQGDELEGGPESWGRAEDRQRHPSFFPRGAGKAGCGQGRLETASSFLPCGLF